MKKLENLGRKLTKDEQKKIIGGNPPGGGNTPCAGDTVVCHVDEVNNITYTCHTDLYPDGSIKECCCGHSAYNQSCWGT